VVNGMSFAAQRSYWANSALIIEVDPARYGGDSPTAGYEWQDVIERKAFDLAGGHIAPAQRVQDMLDRKASTDLPKTSYPMGVVGADLADVLPGHVLKGMRKALRDFDRKLPGFISEDAVLIAPETRTTSPVRLLRDDACMSTTLPGLYPVGEGAGYGGGIVSCAVDGLRAAQAMVAGRAHG
jgi:uncharacterized FAD-dependent dehydrogenase